MNFASIYPKGVRRSGPARAPPPGDPLQAKVVVLHRDTDPPNKYPNLSSHYAHQYPRQGTSFTGNTDQSTLII